MLRKDDIKIRVDTNPSKTDDEFVRDALHQFNIQQVGKEDHYSAFATDSTNEIVGGISVYAEISSIYIDILWVHESKRGQGIGSQLLKAVEQEAIRRKIPFSTTDTFTFQAVDFYIKNDYQKIGIIENYLEGHDRIFFRKKLID
ncbi:MAG: GNAT family N-acetyltransferase [Gammaproteobacteria bacterium]